MISGDSQLHGQDLGDQKRERKERKNEVGGLVVFVGESSAADNGGYCTDGLPREGEEGGKFWVGEVVVEKEHCVRGVVTRCADV